MIKENEKLFHRLNILTDALIIVMSVVIAYFIRFYVIKTAESFLGLDYYIKALVLLGPVQLLIYGANGLYDSFRVKRLLKEFEKVLKCNLLYIIFEFSFFFITKEVHISRYVIVISFFVRTILIVAKRIAMRKYLRYYRKKGYNQKYIIIVGQGELAEKFINTIKVEKSYGYQITGYVADNDAHKSIPYLGTYDDLEDELYKHKPDEVVIALEADEFSKFGNVLRICEKTGTKTLIVPFYAQYMLSRPHIDNVGDIPLINIRKIPLDNIGNSFLKRVSDIIGSIVLIILTSPVMLLIALGIKASSPGGVIFTQTRVGLNKKEFSMYKFRSMKNNREENVGWTTNSDGRKTVFGSFIRKFSLDELPQFINVLKGDMSLVGPRPEVPHYVDEFKETIPLYMVKHQVRPGITGLAQINGFRGDTSIKRRTELDIEYIENWSVLLDLKILILTILKSIVNDEKIIFKSENDTAVSKTTN